LHDSVTYGCKNVMPQTLCHFFLEHPVYRVLCSYTHKLHKCWNRHHTDICTRSQRWTKVEGTLPVFSDG